MNPSWLKCFAMAVSLLAFGCGKTKDEVAEAETLPAPADSANESQPSPVPPGGQPPPNAGAAKAARPVASPNDQLVGMVHGFMTQQLRIFVQQKGRLPQNFAEFASARMDSVPRPPEGFHWAIDERTVEVKLVR